MTVELKKAVENKDWSNVEKLWHYIVSRQRTLKETLSSEDRGTFKTFLTEKRKDRTYILRASAIEQYLPTGSTSLDRTIELVSAKDFDSRMREKLVEYRELKAICRLIVRP